MTGVFEKYFSKFPNDILVVHPMNIFDNFKINKIHKHHVTFDFLKNKNLKIIEPYHSFDVYNKETSIVYETNWLLNGEKEYIQPKIILTDDEKEYGYSFLKKNISNDLKSCLMFQPFGSKFISSEKEDPSFRSLNFSDYEQIIKKYKSNFKFLIFRKDNKFALDKDCFDISFWDFRKIASICYHLDKFISCDSCLNHLAPALNKTAFVIWINTSETIFGHPMNVNYRQKFGQSMIPMKICLPDKVNDMNLNKFDLNKLFLNMDNYLNKPK